MTVTNVKTKYSKFDKLIFLYKNTIQVFFEKHESTIDRKKTSSLNIRQFEYFTERSTLL